MNDAFKNIREVTNSRELYEAKPKPYITNFIYMLLIMIVIALIFLNQFSIDVVSKARGMIVPKSSISTLKSSISSELATIDFENGATVAKGDIIFTFKSTEQSAQQDSVEAELKKVNDDIALANKLIESIEKNDNLFNESTENDGYQKFQQYLLEKLKADESIASLNTKISDLTSKTNGYLAVVNAIDSGSAVKAAKNTYQLYFSAYITERRKLNQDYVYAKEQYNSSLDLHKTGAISTTELNKFKLQMNIAKSAVDQHHATQLLKYQELYNQSYEQLTQLKYELKKVAPIDAKEKTTSYYTFNKLIELRDGIEQLKLKCKQLNGQFEKVKSMYDSTIVRSPIDGVLTMDQSYAVGDFVAAGSTLGSVVPVDVNSLKVKLYMPNNEVGDIAVGDRVKFKIDALPYKEYGMLDGRLSLVNANSTYDRKTGSNYYLVESELNSVFLKSYKGKEESVKPGMNLEGHVVTKQKKLLHVLLEKMNIIN